MFLIQKALSLIFSDPYSQVILNEDENLRYLKFEDEEERLSIHTGNYIV